MKVAFQTFGCRTNAMETDVLTQQAGKMGWQLVEDATDADALVINSCTVTESADKDARQHALKFKRKKPTGIVAVVGCYAQVAKDELLALPEVDLVLGTSEKTRILGLLKDAWENGDWERDEVKAPRGFLVDAFQGSKHARPNIKIQDGCNFACTFCIIPSARGRSRSIPIETVEKLIAEAHAQGFQEVVLSGIHLAHYGWDLGTNLMELLARLLAPETGPRIRLSTLDPFEIPDELIEWAANHPRLCPYFHIALQSGSDRVLKQMKRIYRAQEFVDVARKIFERSPDIFVGVDVITGFPTETDEDFAETRKCLEETPWAKLHVFPYSPRRNTPAAVLKSCVSAAERHARSEQLLNLSHLRYAEFLRRQIGEERTVILETQSARVSERWTGHTENFIPTNVWMADGRPGLAVKRVLESADCQIRY